jgi:hypothetical protein
MKKIYITLITLLLAMTGMAYLYFSRLNTQNAAGDKSFNAAIINSGLVFCMRNDKDIVDILGSQGYFNKIVGPEKSAQLSALKNQFLSDPAVNNLITGSNIYISFLPGENHTINYLISTQLNDDREKETLLGVLKARKIAVDGTGPGWRLTLPDSTVFYLGVKDKMIVLSDDSRPVTLAMDAVMDNQSNAFAAFIKSGDKFNKNSLANLYIDFNRLPQLLKTILTNDLTGELSVLNSQHSFAVLSYNFSKQRMFFSGNTRVNDSRNYLRLFSDLLPQKNMIDHILPGNTANFTLYSIPEYLSWRKSLNDWFTVNTEYNDIRKIITLTNQKYRLDLEEIFPKYFRGQLICFQLKSAEKLGAIQLNNGDKVSQLLLDLSEDYSQDIKLLKEPGLLYCYFGEPFKKFRRPYYTIIDNYMVFANYASSLQAFLNSYQKNDLLVNSPDYSNLFNQISDDANITYYINHQNSTGIIRNTVYPSSYPHFSSGDGMKDFSSFIYQLSGDKGNFQTDFLINIRPDTATAGKF